MTDCNKEHICDAELHFTPGHNVFVEMRRCIVDSAVFVAVVSKNFCKSYFCDVEISEARTTGKPIILIFTENVEVEKMSVVIRDVFMNNARAKIVKEGNKYQMYPPWEQLCKAIIRLIKIDE